MPKYYFGQYVETHAGQTFETIARGQYDSDAQAEHAARRLCEGIGANNMTIARGNVSWIIMTSNP